MTAVLDRPTGGHQHVLAPHPGAVRRGVGGFYLVMAGINAGIAVADPQTYAPFADGSFWPFVTRAWREVVMADPRVWIAVLVVGEIALGALLLHGGRAARAGWVGVLAFQVLLMPFGLGFWTWSLPVLLLLAPVVRRDWPRLAPVADTTAPAPAPHAAVPAALPTSPGSRPRTPTMVGTTVVLAALVVLASLYGLLAQAPYRDLPDSTVLAARAQDACSIVVAVLLLWAVRRPVLSLSTALVRLGLLAYLVYSYLIYLTGVPMNRMFLVYVVIVATAGWGLVAGLLRVGAAPPAATASRRLTRGTGWLLLVTGLLFAGLWLSALLPFALGGARPEPEGPGGVPYPVFVLDLALVLPLIAGVGVLLLRNHAAGPPLAVVALVKIVTLFTALWAGPVVALLTDEPVELGPDAGPSVLLLVVTMALAVAWLRSLDPDRQVERSPS